MRMRIKGAKRLVIWLLAGLPMVAHAGDWMRSAGESGLGVSLEYGTADHYWNRFRKLLKDNCTSNDWKLFLHYEYGYSYDYTLFGNTALDTRRCGNRHSSGLGDIRLGVRGRLNPFRNGSTWELSVLVPTSG
ncbi:hypothetical protein, partial [Alcanivorax sp.]|uniref:hypothetical protein n=1 Tax=Alcanivorax sp. TaxID=1872427 RepID=UPI00258CE3EE